LKQHYSLSKNEYDYYGPVRSKTLDWENNYCYLNGVAQGSPLSPILSTIILVPLLFLNKSGVKAIMYADDGILYSDSPFNPDDILNFPMESGILAHKEGEKSKWIKQDNKWLIPLKFVGIQYTPAELTTSITGNNPKGNLEEKLVQGGIIASATKTPKDFIHTKAKAFGLASMFDKWYNIRNNLIKSKKYHSLAGETLIIGDSYGKLDMNEFMYNNNYSGYIDSRLYLGSYDNIAINPSWNEFKFVDDSWADKEQNSNLSITRVTDLFTASSHATSDLAFILSVKGLNHARFITSKGIHSPKDRQTELDLNLGNLMTRFYGAQLRV